MRRVKTEIIYNRIWKIHPDYPEYAFAENGDVCDITEVPPKILKAYESKESSTKNPYMRVEIRNKEGRRTSFSVAHHLVTLYGMRPWEHAHHFSFRYKDGDFRNIHKSNLEVYKRFPEFKLLFKDDIKEIVSLLKEGKLTQAEIAKKYEVHVNMISKIAKKALRSRRTRVKYDKNRAELEKSFKNAPAEIKKLLEGFIISEASPRGQRNRGFFYEVANERLSSYCVRGMVDRISFRRTAPMTEADAKAQVKLLNEYFFGV